MENSPLEVQNLESLIEIKQKKNNFGVVLKSEHNLNNFLEILCDRAKQSSARKETVLSNYLQVKKLKLWLYFSLTFTHIPLNLIQSNKLSSYKNR